MFTDGDGRTVARFDGLRGLGEVERRPIVVCFALLRGRDIAAARPRLFNQLCTCAMLQPWRSASSAKSICMIAFFWANALSRIHLQFEKTSIDPGLSDDAGRRTDLDLGMIRNRHRRCLPNR